jgi:hypothetical protein
MVLQALLEAPSLSPDELALRLGKEQERIDKVMGELEREGFLQGLAL